MANSHLREMLRAAAVRMADELKQRLVPHRGELGTAREEIVRQFLRSYLPRRFEISSGFVFDAHGNLSQQLDVIIADGMMCPRFSVAGGVHFYPCEAVIAVGQVNAYSG
jgi:hypothetical protein